MERVHDHEVVSIYPFSEVQVDALMQHAVEAVLMWATKDGWPVGVTHAFIWRDGRIWLTFATHRHRAAAIRRDNRVSVNVSSASYPAGAAEDLPSGAITFKGTGEFFEDQATKDWFYPALADKVSGGDATAAEHFQGILDSPLRTILAVTPVKRIMYNAATASSHLQGTARSEELGERLSSDAERMNRERQARGLEPR